MSDQAAKFLAQWEFEHITVVARSDREEQARRLALQRFAYVGAPDGVIIELLEHRQWAAFLGSQLNTGTERVGHDLA